MKDVKVNRNSWTYKVASFFGTESDELESSNNICHYRWKFIKNCFCILLISYPVLALFCSFVWIHYEAIMGLFDEERLLATFVLAGAYAAVGVIVGGGLVWKNWVAPLLYERKIRRWKVESHKENESTFTTMIRSWKEKLCLKVQFIDKE